MSILVPKSQERDSASTLLTNKFTNTKIHLYQSDIPHDPETPLATLVASEATFDGYSAKSSQTWTMIEDDAGLVKLLTANELWTLASVAVTGNDIFGYYVTDSADTTLLAFEPFPASQPMANAGDTIAIVGKYEFPTPTGTFADVE